MWWEWERVWLGVACVHVINNNMTNRKAIVYYVPPEFHSVISGEIHKM